MENKSKKQAEEFPVREGTENSSVLNGQDPLLKDGYPRPDRADHQHNTQPEYTEEQPNRPSPNDPAINKK